MRKLQQAKKCKECGKILGHWNKSGLCSYHLAEAHKNAPETKLKKKAYNIEYYQKNKKKILERMRNCREKNEEEEK